MQTPTTILAGCILAVALPLVSKATVLQYEAAGTFTTSDFPSAVAVGDSFTCRFAYDDSVVGYSLQSNTELFRALTAFEFNLSSGASGNYGGGSLVAPDYVKVGNFANAAFFYIFLDQGFGSITSNSVSLQFSLNDYYHSSSIGAVGSGQTLASVLGGTLDLNQFSDPQLTLSSGKLSAIATITSLEIVPEPGSLPLCLLGAVIIGVGSFACLHRRRFQLRNDDLPSNKNRCSQPPLRRPDGRFYEIRLSEMLLE